MGFPACQALLVSGQVRQPLETYSAFSHPEGALEEGSWATEYPTCDGWRQSPIDLQRKKAQFNPQLKALNLTGYDTAFESLSMTNNGHTGKGGPWQTTQVAR